MITRTQHRQSFLINLCVVTSCVSKGHDGETKLYGWLHCSPSGVAVSTLQCDFQLFLYTKTYTNRLAEKNEDAASTVSKGHDGETKLYGWLHCSPFGVAVSTLQCDFQLFLYTKTYTNRLAEKNGTYYYIYYFDYFFYLFFYIIIKYIIILIISFSHSVP